MGRFNQRVGLLLLGAGTSLLAGPATITLAQEGPAAQARGREEDVWVFALRLDQGFLSAAFPGFPSGAGFLLPLGELCRLLDLAVRVDPKAGSAEGFILEESRRFHLDARGGIVEIRGVKGSFNPAQIELHDDDIYVEARLLSTWLPLDLEVVKRTATITVKPREVVPLQARWARERESGRFQAEPKAVVYPKVADPYRLVELPFIDEFLRLTTPSRAEVKPVVNLQSTTIASGDLLGLSSNLYTVLDTQEGVREFRMTLGRRDPDGELLGPLRATEFAFGEVLNPGLNLVTQASTGSGALVSNFPLQRENAFDRHAFLGDLAPGWQVELYRNQTLIGFQSSRPDGRYGFLNVGLYYGFNEFRLVFYGPQGQRREEVFRFDVSESQTPQGDFQYRLAAGDSKILGPRAQVEGRYGLSKQIAASFSLARVRFDGDLHDYAQAGLQGFWKPLSAALTAVADDRGGSAGELALRTRIGSLSLNAKRTQLQGGFSSEVFNPVYGRIQSRTSLEASALLSKFTRSWVTLDFGGSQDRLADGRLVEHVYQRISASYAGTFLSNELSRSRASGGPAVPLASTTGNLLVSRYFRSFSLRGQADYRFNGRASLNGFTVLAETPLVPNYILRGSLTRTLTSGETLFQVGANKNQGRFCLGLNLNYSARNRLMADLTLQVGLGREPRSGRIQARAQGLAGQGAVSARAFLDANANGVRDPGERDLLGVGFRVNGASHPGATEANRPAFLTGLSPDQDANLSVASASLEDPLMRPGIPGLRVVPRPGHTAMVDLPVALFGEINGTVFQKRDGENQELAGLGLELVAQSGNAVRRLRTGYDGYFSFEELPPGTYRLQVPEAEARRNELAAPAARTVRIAADGTVIDGLVLVLGPAAKEGP